MKYGIIFVVSNFCLLTKKNWLILLKRASFYI